MLNRIKVVDIELCRPPATIDGLEGYGALKGLVRLHGTPIGFVKVPVTDGRCSAIVLSKAILEQHSRAIIHHLLCDALAAPTRPGQLRMADLLDVSHPICQGTLPLVTVAVCTRDRTDDLARCLDSLSCLDYPALEVLVVDNAPSSNATERLVRTRYPNWRYVCEPRPGLNWARNRAIIESRGEIIAYTDDDVVVDPGWIKALVSVFADNSDVMAVTGLVVPYELETEAQILFERYGGFARGFKRHWYRVNCESDERAATQHGGAGKFGTGANMAYRRSLFDKIGYFDPALDVGTATNGGGDLEMFFRVLKEGYVLVYEPRAVVRHRHRREYAQLRTQITNNGIGFYSYLVRSALAYPDERFVFIQLGLWWLWWWNIRRLLISFVRPGRFPRDLILAELRGSFTGLGRYQQAQRIAGKITATFGPLMPAIVMVPQECAWQQTIPKDPNAVAVRIIDLGQPLCTLTDVTRYTNVRVFIASNDLLLGSVDIANHGQPISTAWLRDCIADRLIRDLPVPDPNLITTSLPTSPLAALGRCSMPANDRTVAMPVKLPNDVSASVVVATYDRPDDLRSCLRCLVAQKSPRQVEIVVVDNNPTSGLTPPIVAEFPNVVLVSEHRKGLSYARNLGIATSKGDIVITTDDDVTIPPDWLEKLVTPFVRTDVMIVTGNTLPLELETKAQRLFETYGGLGRGFQPLEVNGDWFKSFWYRAVPTYYLGATANAAFRTSIFSHPQIGLLDEALGAGSPTGCSEDTYLFYKVLKAGYTLVYVPSAYVWHKHRRDMPALRRQLYNYAKGHVAYHLTTLIRDHDLRALIQLAVWIPSTPLLRVKERLHTGSNYPLSLMLVESIGLLAGPWALWQSRRRVKRKGLSKPYVPVSQRSQAVGQLTSVESNSAQRVGHSSVSGRS